MCRSCVIGRETARVALLSRLLLAVACAIGTLMGASSSMMAQRPGPLPPCQDDSAPPYPAPGLATIQSWTRAQLGADWIPPACTGWRDPGAKMLVAVSASFTYDGSVGELLARFGAVSGLRGIRYWSVTDGEWRPLILDAAALAGADSQQRRADFSPAELRSGAPLYFLERDSRSGDVVYRMQLLASGKDGFVLAVENASPIRYLLFTLFSPGDMQSVYFVERRGGDLWGYYSLMRAGAHAGSLAAGHAGSYMNRAQALYRHFVGLPTDSDPPAAR
jgi:hypothetical protein